MKFEPELTMVIDSKFDDGIGGHVSRRSSDID